MMANIQSKTQRYLLFNARVCPCSSSSVEEEAKPASASRARLESDTAHLSPDLPLLILDLLPEIAITFHQEDGWGGMVSC